MTEHGLNRALAIELGFDVIVDDKDGTRVVGYIHRACHAAIEAEHFTPANSVDDLREYVLPVLERRGLFRAWVDAVAKGMTDKQLEAAFAATGVLPAQFQVDPQEAGYVLASVMWGAGAHALAAAALVALRAQRV